jgi:3-hydroxymyristoyl/3-hydroxydecanoyl-(acyl carrier protein) dehydratase
MMMVEAMAQIGGSLVFRDDARPAYLTAIDDVRFAVDPASIEALDLRVTLDADFGGMFRFSGSGTNAGTELVRARFYLSRPEEEKAVDA